MSATKLAVEALKQSQAIAAAAKALLTTHRFMLDGLEALLPSMDPPTRARLLDLVAETNAVLLAADADLDEALAAAEASVPESPA